jgi:hypothetical protein
MKNTLKIFVILLLLPFSAFADTYNLAVSWTDTTPTGAQYTPAYNVEYQIGAAAVVAASDQPSPSYSTQIIANPGDVVQVRVQNKNTQGPTLSAWSLWINATAQAAPTTPANPSGITFTLTRIP